MAEDLKQELLAPDESASSSRLRLSEIGYTGIKQAHGLIYEEANRKLRFPEWINEVNLMLNDATVATGVNFIRTMLSRVKWKVKPPKDATDEQKEKAKFIETCMHDMEHSWHEFITELTNYIPYGFQVHEKVFRRRLRNAGSKYNDGLVGWRKLPVRSQSTIKEWKYSDDGRTILGLKQSTSNLTNMMSVPISPLDALLDIPREKFLLFTADERLGNPLGKSPLAAVWTQWKYRQELEKQESIGVGRDLGGIPVAGVPSRFMSESASDSEKAVYAYVKKMVANLHQNSQAGIVFPSDVDENSKQPYFTFKLLASEGGGRYDTNEVIKRINSAILVALGADVLAMGTDKVGSFSLAGTKTSLVALMLENRLREIQDVLNNDLIKSTFKENRWTDTDFPTVEFEEFDEISPDEMSSFIQRVASQGLIAKDLETINRIRKVLGVSELPSDTDIDELEFTDAKSRSGDGAAAGGLNGTSTSGPTQDNSIANVEN